MTAGSDTKSRMGLDEAAQLRLLCVPGTLCNDRVFAPLLAALDAGGLVFNAETADYTAARSVGEAAQRVLVRCGIQPNDSVIILGFSLGGIVAVQLALALQDQLTGLILIDMNADADKPENAVVRRSAVARARQTSLATYVSEVVWPTHVADRHRGDTRLHDTIVVMAEECGLDTFANQAEIAISRPRALDALPALRVPVLVLCGTEDAITPPHLSRTIAAALPAATLHLIEGAGHFAPLESPDDVAAAICTWIGELPRVAQSRAD